MAKSRFSRRRFLTDLLALGGTLGAAAVLARPRPFFELFLESHAEPPVAANPIPPSSTPTPVPPPSEAPPVTKAFPSDLHNYGRDPVLVTASLQDSQRWQPDVTEAYPSDSDLHQPVLPSSPPNREKSEACRPIWKRWA